MIDIKTYENEKQKSIDSLMLEWKNSFSEKSRELFVNDGFYPYYFAQKTKILFMGKESLEMAGGNYIDELSECYAKSKKVGGIPLNSYAFHRRILYLAYGILNKKSSLEDFNAMPTADKIGDGFATENGISFAFMNISKVSNETTICADMEIIKKRAEDNKKFIRREIDILEPDIIISGNIGHILAPMFDNFEVVERLGEDVCVHKVKLNGREILYLDCWHFSYPKKFDFENFYSPVCSAVKKYKQKNS